MIPTTNRIAQDLCLADTPSVAEAEPRRMREIVQETIRQLAEATERCTAHSTSAHAPQAPAMHQAAAALPTAAAIALPHASPRLRPTQRDALAMSGIKYVLERADSQHVETRDLYTINDVMPHIDPTYVAFHACQPLRLSGVGAATSDGTRPYQQDIAVADWHNPHAVAIAAVCDGHGIGAPGDVTPWQHLQKHLISTMRAHLPARDAAATLAPRRIIKALTRAIDNSRLHPQTPLSVLEQMRDISAIENGCTLTAAVRIANTIYVVNVGDSRAVLVRRDGSTQQLTVDHNIDEPHEWRMVNARVDAGQATLAEPQPGLYRMVRHARGGDVYGINMSRSIGDDQATASTPDISMISVSHDDLALVIASDGVFGTVHNEQVGRYVGDIMNLSRGTTQGRAQRAAEGLVNWCFDVETQQQKSVPDIDNLTALVLPLHGEA